MAKPTPCAQPLLLLIFVFFLATLLKDPGAAAQLYSNCTGNRTLIGDAICDINLNREACGYDGGDCCECTCLDTAENSCGSGAGFFCSDPDVPSNCTITTSPTPSPTFAPQVDLYADCEGYLPHIQDGYCDSDLNVAECDWDGGDCCACTCLEGLTHECGDIGDGFDCQDPDAPSDCDEALLADCTGYMDDYQNGCCDYDLNNAECRWDGGDCCRCTCRDYTYDYDDDWWGYYDDNLCGVCEYDCLDPDAPTDCDTEAPTPSPAQNTPYPDCEGLLYWIGDGYCDSSLNNEECGWDGGDCCEDGSCLSCLDPDAQCVEVTPSPTPTLYTDCPNYNLVGDGDCHSTTNTEECDWDGGDCCPCTCLGTYYDCVDFDCIDPSADCSSTTYSNDVTYDREDNGSSIIDDDDSFTNTARTTSIENETSGFSGVQIIGVFALAVFCFCCLGGCIVGFFYIFHHKWVGAGVESATQPTGAQPQPLPQAYAPSALVPPQPSGSNTVVFAQPGGGGQGDVKVSED